MQVFYRTENDDTYFKCDTRFTFDSPSRVAQDCADDFWTKHDGSEALWPHEIKIFEAPNVESYRGTFEVMQEMEPIFWATFKY